MNQPSLPEYIGDLPNICGSEKLIEEAMSAAGTSYLPNSGVDFARARSAFAIALHMHQPLVPAGGDDLRSARIISNLRRMKEGADSGDRYNAGIFEWCYRRMGEIIPQLLSAGAKPRIMLDYSGCLFHGLRQMGAHEVFDRLKEITVDPSNRRCVEWLGSTWGHAVAPSTPPADFRLHVRAWQHHFAAIFGLDALSRVRGFSPAEMALPNHPDVCYEMLRTLRDCGYRWILVQEHSVENVGGGAVRDPHLPHRLVARNSLGQELSLTALIKTQGSDTKLVGQMQPYYEAKGLRLMQLAGRMVPPLVTQIADGENGGVMMNEFPPKYVEVMKRASGTATAPANVGEYLRSIGVSESDFGPIQPVMQQRIWDRFPPGAGPEAMEALIAQLRREDGRFHVEGGSWTARKSWVRGYEDLLRSMDSASAMFRDELIARGVPTSDPRYRRALFHLLVAQTSCYRYWGRGIWTDYGRELCSRAIDALQHE